MAHHRFPGWSLNKARSAARTSGGNLARRAASSKSALESTGGVAWTCFSTPTSDLTSPFPRTRVFPEIYRVCSILAGGIDLQRFLGRLALFRGLREALKAPEHC